MGKKLTSYKDGDRVKIMRINAGHGALVNLINLGLNIGNIVEIGRKSNMKGPVIVSYQGTEVAIGYGLATKIIAEIA